MAYLNTCSSHSVRGSDEPQAVRRGRVERNILPQEYELASLIRDVQNPDPSWTTHTKACDWRGITCEEASPANLQVTGVKWRGYGLKGTIHWPSIPITTRSFDLSSSFVTFQFNRLEGEVDLTVLPHELQVLELYYCQFSGTVNLTDLPLELIDLDLRGNKFIGEVDFTRLPPKLKVLRLCYNKFKGEADFRDLPPTIDVLSIFQTELEPLKGFVPDCVQRTISYRSTVVPQ